MNRYLKTVVIAAPLIILLVAGAAALYGYHYVNSPPGQLKGEVNIEIDPGTSFYAAAKRLKKAEVIGSIRLFHLYAKFRGSLSGIKAGEYLLQPAMTTKEIMDQLVEGNVIRHRVTVPEGYNLYQVAELLDEKGIVEKKDFIQKAHDPELIAKLGIKGLSFEGYLYPETYFFIKGMTSEEIIARMVSRFKKVFTEDLVNKAAEIGFTPEQVINLASIIEKETGNPAERPLISAVFHNRMKKRMRLQSDPTVIYGMIETFDGNIRKKDLKKKTPYNTYRIGGLPAGPVANPGFDAIKAVLYPDKTKALYFVSMNNGSHVFAETLEQHNRNVWKYQKRRRR